jgi:hypothetical protein
MIPIRFRSPALFLCGALAVAAVLASAGARADGGFQRAYAPGSRDAAGRFMGGTELRILTAYQGKLYAGNGYWEDRPGAEGPQGAEILVLDGPGAAWRVDYVFDGRMPNGRPREFTVSALAGVRFETDGAGARLPRPVSMLLASAWDLTGAVRVHSRDDATGAWSAVTLAQDAPAPDFLPQLRSFGTHRDRQTGADLVFAGTDPRGIFRGAVDAAVSGRIRWTAAPEFDISTLSTAGFPGLAGRLRVGSFAECNGILYAAIGQQIFARQDGTSPTWRLVYTNSRPGHSETGLRGLTAIRDPGGSGEVLLAAVEGDAARILRIDPGTGADVSELDLLPFLGKAWRMRVGYTIAAYNDMTKLRDIGGEEVVLIGLESFIPPQAPIAAGHAAVNVGYGRVEAGAWYLVRHPGARYGLRRIALPTDPDRAMVATRTIAASPFPGDAAGLYFGGYDANKAPAHDTAWIVRADAATALDAPP